MPGNMIRLPIRGQRCPPCPGPEGIIHAALQSVINYIWEEESVALPTGMNLDPIALRWQQLNQQPAEVHAMVRQKLLLRILRQSILTCGQMDQLPPLSKTFVQERIRLPLQILPDVQVLYK